MFITDAPRSTVLLCMPGRGEALAAPDALLAGLAESGGVQGAMQLVQVGVPTDA